MPSPAPGWYPDPSGTPQQRYFDGNRWTEQVAPFPSPPAPAAPPQKHDRKVTLIIAGVIVGLFAVSGACSSLISGGSDSSKKSTTTSAASTGALTTKTQAVPTATKAAAPMGQEVRDGKFAFTVLGVERGSTSLDDAFGPEKAKGEFFTVNIRVTNIGDEARSFSATNQKLIVNGNEYEATSFMDNGWMEEINPGLGIDTRAVFDIPPGATPEAIEFHDSIFSGGALAALK